MHLSSECHLYPNSIFIIEGCNKCKEKGYYACHPNDNCKGVDKIYVEYFELQKAAKASRKQWKKKTKCKSLL